MIYYPLIQFCIIYGWYKTHWYKVVSFLFHPVSTRVVGTYLQFLLHKNENEKRIQKDYKFFLFIYKKQNKIIVKFKISMKKNYLFIWSFRQKSFPVKNLSPSKIFPRQISSLSKIFPRQIPPRQKSSPVKYL